MFRRTRLLPLSLLLVALPAAFVPAAGCGPVSSDLSAAPQTDGGASSSGSSGASGSPEGGTTSEGGRSDGAESACAPGDVQIFQPGAYVPASEPMSVCGADTVQALYDDCLGPNKDATACSSFQAQYKACYDCVLTPNSASSYGPIVLYRGFVEPNVAGCAQLVSHGVLACARPVQALAECQLAACEVNCPVSDALSLSAFASCAAQARTGGCQAYDAEASCLAVDFGPLSVCDPSDFASFYAAVVPLFCAAGDALAPLPLRDAASE